MNPTIKSEVVTTPEFSVEANIKSLAEIAYGLVDRKAEIDRTNVDLFAETAFFVTMVLRHTDKLKEFIKLMKSLDIKLPPDLKKAAGTELTKAETSKLGQSNLLLPMMRTIFHSKEGKLRSFENHAYPMTELLKDDTLVTLDQIKAAVETAVHVTSSGKSLTGIEALRARERESRKGDGSRKGTQSSRSTPQGLNYLKGCGKVAKEIAETIKFNDEGFGKIIVRRAPDGTVDMLFGGPDVAGVTESLIEGWEKIKGKFQLDPRYKLEELPTGIRATLPVKEAA